jgi:hypothetical protein
MKSRYFNIESFTKHRDRGDEWGLYASSLDGANDY